MFLPTVENQSSKMSFCLTIYLRSGDKQCESWDIIKAGSDASVDRKLSVSHPFYLSLIFTHPSTWVEPVGSLPDENYQFIGVICLDCSPVQSTRQYSLLSGKLSEVEAKNLILLGEIKNLNSSFNEEKEVQRNTVKGLERLGDSLASMKVSWRRSSE